MRPTDQRRRRRSGAVALCIGTALLPGCQSRDESSPAARGGTLVAALQGEIDSWNPYTAADATSAGVLDLLYPRLLLEVGSDGDPEGFRPWLAESWSFSEDRLALTFRLRSDARWSDGASVTCEDVRFTHRIQIAEELAWSGAFLKERILGVECPDTRTAVFRYSEAYPDQLIDANDDAILPSVYGDVALEQWSATAWHDRLVSCGPFRLDNVRPGQEVVLSADPDWWAADTVFVDRVVLRIYPDETASVAAFLAGEVDVLAKVPPLQAATVQSSSHLRLVELPSLSFTYFAWNTLEPGAYLEDRRRRGCGEADCEESPADIARLRRRRAHPALADPGVRLALSLGIDRGDIVEGVWHGYAVAGTSPIVSAQWAHDELSGSVAYDPGRAEQLLEASGWVDGDGDGVRERAGRELNLRVIVNAANKSRLDALERAAANLQRIGVRLTAEPLPRGEYVARARDKDFDCALSGWWAGTRIEPQNLLHSAAAVSRGNNITSWSTEESDRLMDRAASTRSREQARPLWVAWQKHFRDEQPLTILYEERRLLGLNARVGGPAPPFLNPYLGLSTWSISPQTARLD